MDRDGFHIEPYLQNSTSNAVTILWETSTPVPGEVEFGPWAEKSPYDQRAVESQAARIHRVRIQDLIPDARYRYRVRHQGVVREGQFRTAPAQQRPIRFAVIGDSRFWQQYWERSRLPEHLADRKPEFIVHMGDLVLKGHDYTLWPAHFARFGSLMANVPMFPTRGNHEGDTKDAATDWFAKYFELPGGEPYSAFNWGNAHFALASYYQVTGTNQSRTVRFLDDDLGATHQPWKFVAFHQPIYCTGYFEAGDNRKSRGNPAYEAVLDRHHVDMHLGGHTHIYERSFPYRGGQRQDPGGTVYLVEGGNVGGYFPEPWSALVSKDMDMPYYTLIEVAQDYLELRSYGLAKGAKSRRMAAPIVEFDHYLRWRNEAMPRAALAQLDTARGSELAEAIERLGAMMYAPAAPRLTVYLSSRQSALQDAAALALERIANPAVAEALLPHLRHPDAAIRRHVARALECAMPGSLAPQLEPLIRDENQDSAVRIALLGAILYHAPDRAYALGWQMLASRQNDVRDRAADIVKRTAKPQDLNVLLRLYRQEMRPFVAGCLAAGLNRLTGAKVDVAKAGAAKISSRDIYLQQWQRN